MKKKRTSQNKNAGADFKLFGIFGKPLQHTLSPVFQEAGFEAVGHKAFYLVFDFDLSQFQRSMRRLPSLLVEGFNVTVPYKEKVLRYLDQISAEAKCVGAVNTVYQQGKKWCGANTDVYGFTQALEKDHRFRLKGKQVLILGAGGSARAVVAACLKDGVKGIFIANRHLHRAQGLKRHFRTFAKKTLLEAIRLEKESLKEALQKADLVVNTTSVGLRSKDRSLLSLSQIPKANGKKRKLFFDLIYKPKKTHFLKVAASRGHRTANGLSMLLYQGTASFEIWTRKKAPVAVMKKALLQALESDKKV